MRFEWDPAKAQRNLAKHGVSFEEAATVFADRLSLTSLDPDHSEDEDRYLLLGASYAARLVVVSHRHRGEGGERCLQVDKAQACSQGGAATKGMRGTGFARRLSPDR